MAKRKRAQEPLAAETPGDTSHSLGMELRNAYFALRRCSNAHCATFGANGDQFVLLKLLAEEDGLRQQDLVQRGGYDATTTGTMLRRMGQRGWVTRQSDPHDARAKRVRLTAAGRGLQRDLWLQSERLRIALLDSVPLRQRKMFVETLQLIANAMDETRAASRAARQELRAKSCAARGIG